MLTADKLDELRLFWRSLSRGDRTRLAVGFLFRYVGKSLRFVWQGFLFGIGIWLALMLIGTRVICK